MAGLNGQWKALQKQLRQLEAQTRKARGEARKRLKKVERQTRVAIKKAIREAEPRVRQAVDEAARIGRGLRAGVRAGTAAYRSGGRRPK
jgi:predicted metal-dependent hydrolase